MAPNGNTAPGFPPISSAPFVESAPIADPEVHVNDEHVDAQTTGPPATSPPQVMVHEVHYAADHVITDPHSEYAVQIPEAGRGNAMTPMGNAYHALKPEEVFAAEAKPAAKPTK